MNTPLTLSPDSVQAIKRVLTAIDHIKDEFDGVSSIDMGTDNLVVLTVYEAPRPQWDTEWQTIAFTMDELMTWDSKTLRAHARDRWNEDRQREQEEAAKKRREAEEENERLLRAQQAKQEAERPAKERALLRELAARYPDELTQKP